MEEGWPRGQTHHLDSARVPGRHVWLRATLANMESSLPAPLPLNILPPLTLTAALQDQFSYHSHFTDAETEAYIQSHTALNVKQTRFPGTLP